MKNINKGRINKSSHGGRSMIKAHSASVKRRASMYSEIADTAGTTSLVYPH